VAPIGLDRVRFRGSRGSQALVPPGRRVKVRRQEVGCGAGRLAELPPQCRGRGEAGLPGDEVDTVVGLLQELLCPAQPLLVEPAADRTPGFLWGRGFTARHPEAGTSRPVAGGAAASPAGQSGVR
jgi:hypothetical protein